MSSLHEPSATHLLDEPIAEPHTDASKPARDGHTEELRDFSATGAGETTEGGLGGDKPDQKIAKADAATQEESPQEAKSQDAAPGGKAMADVPSGSAQAKEGSSTAAPQDSVKQLETSTVSLGLANEQGAPKDAKEQRPNSSPPPPPPPKDEKYLSGASPMASPLLQHGDGGADDAPDASPNGEFSAQDKAEGQDEEGADSRSEIQSIMDQFNEDKGAPAEEEIMSPRWEKAGPLLGAQAVHPPRRSSLEPLKAQAMTSPTSDSASSSSQAIQSPPPRSSSLHSSHPHAAAIAEESRNDQASPRPPSSLFKPPPLEPDPEPDLPFDFHRFLEQLRHRTADPVAKFLRSFLLEFGKKQWMVHEQVKIISDFLEFISKKMAQCEVWRTVSDAEFDNAREGMEKLVMNRLYTQTFSPAIPPPEPVTGSRRRRQEPTSGRRGQHQEDVERDEVLAQKVRIYGWVSEEHLDIKPVGDKGRKFLKLAQAELLKIKSYRAPRDKVICVLNCCKVIFGFLRNAQSDQSADSFVPLLIYTVLQANPEHLVSNVQYILRFRNQDKLGGEAGYYISSLMGAVQFIENLDRTSLTVSDEEFEKHVEAAVSAIAERPSTDLDRSLQAPPPSQHRHPSPHPGLPMPTEKSALSRPEVTPRNSLEAERAAPSRTTSARNGARDTDDSEENAAVAGLLRTIQRPLSTIGRIFSDDNTEKLQASASSSAPSSQPALTPQPGSTPRLSPIPAQLQGHQRPSSSDGRKRSVEMQRRQQMSAEDAAARQASAEAEEARRLQRQEHAVVVETLAGMFPALDREIISDVVRQKEGRVGLAVDACLALSN